MSYKIKKITYKSDGKVAVVFTGDLKMSLSQNTALEMKLGADMVLSDAEFARLESLDHEEKCKKKWTEYYLNEK